MHNWLPDFQLETATFLPGIEIETATFIVESRIPRITESQNPSGVSRIPATFLPGIRLEP